MTVEEYQDLIDARDAEAAMRSIAAGTLQTLSGDDVDAYLAAATPLAFWRRHRGFTQADMAKEIGVSQPYLAQLENGQREGSISVYRRLTRRLGVGVDELLPDDPKAWQPVGPGFSAERWHNLETAPADAINRE